MSQATPSANYRVIINLTPENFDYQRAKADGGDLRFYEADGRQLSYNRLTWNNMSDSTVVVQVVTSGTSTIYMYYGNSGATDSSDAALASLEPEDTDFEESIDFKGIWEQKASNTNPGWTVEVDVHEGPRHYVDISDDTNAFNGHIYVGQEFKAPVDLASASFSTDYQSYCSRSDRGGWVHIMVVEDSVWQSGISGDFRNIPSIWQGAIKENTADVTLWMQGKALPRAGYSDLAVTLNSWTTANPGGKLWAVVVWTDWHGDRVEWGKIDNFKLTFTSSSEPIISGEPQAAR